MHQFLNFDSRHSFYFKSIIHYHFILLQIYITDLVISTWHDPATPNGVIYILEIIPFRYNMMTSSNRSIFRVTGHLCGEFSVTGEFPAQRPVTRSFDAVFDMRLNKWLCKQSWGWQFETPSRSLWRHCYENVACSLHCNRHPPMFITLHDDVIKWKQCPRYWPFVRGSHRSRWNPRTKASDGKLWCFLWFAPE